MSTNIQKDFEGFIDCIGEPSNQEEEIIQLVKDRVKDWVLSKRPSCCSMEAKIFLQRCMDLAVFFSLIKIDRVNESLIFIIFIYSPELKAWQKDYRDSFELCTYSLQNMCSKTFWKLTEKHLLRSLASTNLQASSLQLY